MKISITRPWAYFGAVRKLKVLADNKLIAELSTRETKAIELPDEAQTVQVKMDWCKSSPVSLNTSGKAFKVECVNVFLAVIYCFVAPSKVFRLIDESAANGPG